MGGRGFVGRSPRGRELRCIPSREPFEKHHIFPQEPLLAGWFKRQSIDIHAFTIRLPRSFHSWLHYCQER
ncbi:hypothetical protein CYFUS_004026 [Cystobacter fuscus]|uniref:Uncharacterized protein n=1 Tax=Cystobacter fuscus TaxID=43 RepID=A0A250J5D1_9BACT|nr:DUF2380 domain-containing protein [Cystobacter fuscus]ATB38591.1 hypothetical protein CYFUS_004026 [Cystobacter fuscus]